MMTSDSTLRMRSIYAADFPHESRQKHDTAAADDFLPPDAEAQTRKHDGGDADSPPASGDGAGDANGLGGSSNDAGDPEPMQLPPSTHSLLFTQPVGSLPFAFSAGIAAMSFFCLALAFWNNMDLENAPHQDGIPNLPVNVSTTVRAAQYFGIIIVLLMEEGMFVFSSFNFFPSINVFSSPRTSNLKIVT